MGDFYLDLVKIVDKMVETIQGVDKMVGLDKFLVVDKMVGLDKLLGVKDLKLVDMEDAMSSIVQESV